MVVFPVLHPTEFIFLNSSNLLEHLVMLMTLTLVINFLTPKLLKQYYRYLKLRKNFFLNFIADTMIWISKFHVRFNSLLRQELSEQEFFGDLVYKLKKIVGTNTYSVQFLKTNFSL